MKIVTLAALVGAAAAITTPAVAADGYSFTKDGVRFHVQEETVENGIRLIKGSDSTGATFSYRVDGNRVDGTYRGAPVNFTVPAPRTQRLALR